MCRSPSLRWLSVRGAGQFSCAAFSNLGTGDQYDCSKHSARASLTGDSTRGPADSDSLVVERLLTTSESENALYSNASFPEPFLFHTFFSLLLTGKRFGQEAVESKNDRSWNSGVFIEPFDNHTIR